MLWDEIDVEGPLTGQEIGGRLAVALKIPVDRIEVSDSIGAKAAPKGVEVRVEVLKQKGQFPIRLGIYFVGAKTAPTDRERIQGALARGLGKRLLVGDASADPYRRILVEPTGNRRLVDLQVEALDERDEIRLDEPTVGRSIAVLKSDKGAEKVLDPKRGLIVGRGPDSGLKVEDPLLGRRHFELRHTDGAWWVEDLKSPSGIFVNDLLARGPTKLGRGDRIRAGGTVFTFE